MKNILEIIGIRRSVRTYLKKPIPPELLGRVEKAFEDAERLNNVAVRLTMEPAERVEHAMTGLVGSYGSMKNAPAYAVGISGEGPNDRVNFGFVMEQFILECTRAGMGTCWVGGFFKKSLMENAVTLNPGERIICVSPVGYSAERRIGERTMRTLGGLNTRRPLNERVFFGRWGQPATQYLNGRPDFEKLFEAARWAPSASNRQPVHFVMDAERIVATVLTTLAAKYMSVLGSDRSEKLDFQEVDAGIAMAHISLAAEHLGITGTWKLDFTDISLRNRYGIPAEAKIIGVFEFDGRMTA
jgi:nitroreductase